MKITKLITVKSLASVLLLALFALKSVQNADAQNTGTFIDPRDGETYTTITIEDPLAGTKVTWMAQNLRYRTANSWAYDNQEGYVRNLGRLYTWEAALRACPAGWRLPSDADWGALVNEFGGLQIAGTALKSTRGWYNDRNGTNTSGFSGLPGGYRDPNGTFGYIGKSGVWWSSTERHTFFAWTRDLSYQNGGVSRYSPPKQDGFSVRCLRD